VWRNITKAIRELEKAYRDALNGYRPERHYMRGPGPKWHAKRTAESAVRSLESAPLGGLAEARA
jgi:hypothetical protein